MQLFRCKIGYKNGQAGRGFKIVEESYIFISLFPRFCKSTVDSNNCSYANKSKKKKRGYLAGKNESFKRLGIPVLNNFMSFSFSLEACRYGISVQSYPNIPMNSVNRKKTAMKLTESKIDTHAMVWAVTKYEVVPTLSSYYATGKLSFEQYVITQTKRVSMCRACKQVVTPEILQPFSYKTTYNTSNSFLG